MDAFLVKFYERVDDYLGDPSFTKRTSKSKKLSDFDSVERRIWQKLIGCAGQKQSFARTEVNIEVVSGTAAYPLPGNFMSFISFEKRTDPTDPGTMTISLGTVGEYTSKAGVRIHGADRGLEFVPIPLSESEGTWTLTYLRGPCLLHYARAQAISTRSITFGTPVTDAGELVTRDDYYNGTVLNVYRADSGAPQAVELADFNGQTRTGILKHPWSPQPSGAVYYEIRPLLPQGIDQLYAVEVAMLHAVRRMQLVRWKMIQEERRNLWSAALRWAGGSALDRPSELPIAMRRTVNPYGY